MPTSTTLSLTLVATCVLAALGPPAAPGAAAAPAPVCDGVRATIVGTAGRDTLVGTPGRDVIAGLAGADTIDGRGGDDLVCGGSGSDRLSGGPGHDRLLGGGNGWIPDEPPLPVGDLLDGGPGDDVLDARAGEGDDRAAFSGPAGITGDLGTGSVTGQGHDRVLGVEVVIGSPAADELVVGGTVTAVVAGGGADHVSCPVTPGCSLAGGSGDDELLGGPSSTVDGGPGQDVLTGTTLHGDEGADDLTGSGGEDWLVGGGGDDTIRAAAGDDDVEGNAGADVIDAGDGADWVQDGAGVDVVTAGAGDDTVQPADGDDEAFDLGDGTDTIDYAQVGFDGTGVNVDLATGETSGVAGNDTLTGAENAVGSYGDDVLLGTDAGENLDGNVGTDVVHALGGDDVITDDYGPDTVDAGPGDDVLHLLPTFTGESSDTYTGGGGVDTLDLSRTYPAGPLVVDLASGTLTGLGDDVLSGLENVIGTLYDDDVLRGDDGPNRLVGRGGDDELVGRGGDDVLTGGPDHDTADGGDGTDTCAAETVTACEG